MKRIIVFFMVIGLSTNFYAQRFLLDSTKQHRNSGVRLKPVIEKNIKHKQYGCAIPQEMVCDKNSMPCGRPDWICSPCERIKSDYFRYGPYTYPYIYNQPGFYFGPGIQNNHYW